MGDKLVVDTDGLANLSTTMAEIGEALDATRDLIEGARDDLGSGDLWDALDDFENNWDDGRGQIKKNMDATREVLGEAVKAYEQADEELRKNLEDNFDPDAPGSNGQAPV